MQFINPYTGTTHATDSFKTGRIYDYAQELVFFDAGDTEPVGAFRGIHRIVCADTSRGMSFNVTIVADKHNNVDLSRKYDEILRQYDNGDYSRLSFPDSLDIEFYDFVKASM